MTEIAVPVDGLWVLPVYVIYHRCASESFTHKWLQVIEDM